MKEEIKKRLVGIFLTEWRNTTWRLKAYKTERVAYDWNNFKEVNKG